MLDPTLAVTGYGSATDAAGDFQGAAVLDVHRGSKADAPADGYPVLFPAEGAVVPALSYRSESPDPLTSCAGFASPTGLPLLVQTDDGARVVEASVTDDRGRGAATCVFDGNTYRNGDAREQELGRAVLAARGASVVIPREPLRPGTRYDVAARLDDGTRLRWSFSTLAGGVRLGEDDARSTAIAVSRERFGEGEASLAVLARDDDFADSLAGTSLLGDGPMLLTGTGELDARVGAELRRAVRPAGAVYLLGLEQALSGRVEDAVTELGLRPVRLGGAERIATSVAIGEEVRRRSSGADEVLVVRGYPDEFVPSRAWADALTVGAYSARGIPVLLTPPERGSELVAATVDRWQPRVRTVIGGRGAVSDAAAASAGATRRVEGEERAATGVRIAYELIGGIGDHAVVVQGYDADAWSYGLPAGGLAADLGAPLLVVGADVPTATGAALCPAPEGRVLTLVGGAGVIGQAVEDELLGC